jgi:hypothetical protein
MSEQNPTPSADTPSTETMLKGGRAKFGMGWNDALYLANGLQPVDEAVIRVGDDLKPVDVMAAITVRGDASEEVKVVLAKDVADPESQLVAHRVQPQEDGTLLSEEAIPMDESKPHVLTGKNSEKIIFSPSDPKHRGWPSIRTRGVGATIVVAESSQPAYESSLKADRKRARRHKAKRVGAAALIVATFKAATLPGGIYDRIMDGSSNAQTYVTDRLSGLENDDGYLPAAEKGPDGKLHVPPSPEKQYEAAVKRLAQTMGDLDEHRFDEVIARADAFESTHQAEIMSDAEVETYKTMLAQTKTTEEAVKVVDQFLNTYNAYASVSDQLSPTQVAGDDFHSQVQYAGTAIFEVLGPLPKSLVKQGIGSGEFETRGIQFTFGNRSKHVNAYGTELAHWDGLNIVIRDTGQIVGIKLDNFKQTVAHEFTHSILYGGILEYKANDADYGNILTRAENIGSHLLGSPEFTSDYATKNREEEVADDGGDILRGEIPKPDHVLDFESRANETRLKVMAALEVKTPGIIDYLIRRVNPGMLK